jgi:hypothetical protein
VKTVYWSYMASPENYQKMMLLLKEPYSLSENLFKKAELDNGYMICPANKKNLKNTFVIDYPKDFYYKYSEDMQSIEGDLDFLLLRNPNFENRAGIDIDIEYIFFCEDSLIMEMMPPYQHKTTVSQYGVISSGRFDIGKWFRPITFNHFLWENEKEFVAKENEPAVYLRFETEEKIKLQFFDMNQNLLNSMRACVNHRLFYKTMIPLLQKYEIFGKSKLKKHIIKNIKDNLLN